MNLPEKTEFIANLCNSVRDGLISRAPEMPPEWDGMELRELLADLFARECFMRYNKPRYRKRLRDFLNELHTRNIL